MKIVTTKGCGLCFRVKTLLKGKNIDFTEVPATSGEGVRLSYKTENKELPILETDDGTVLSGVDAFNYVKGL